MYFPTSVAKHLSSVPPLPNIPPEGVVALVPSPRRSLFCTVTRNGVCVWAIRPPAVLAFLSRTPTSLVDHGHNLDAWWSADSERIVVKTSESYLVLISVEYNPEESVCISPTLSVSTQRNFLAGPGEGLPMQAVSLHLEGVIRVEGTLLSVSPRKEFLMFTTESPNTVQSIPWPVDDDDSVDYPATGSSRGQYATWILNEDDFLWLKEPEVSVTDVSYSRAIGSETWITSDGRIYLVQLCQDTLPHEEDEDLKSPPGGRKVLAWNGSCIHDFELPKWVQKRKENDPQDIRAGLDIWSEPRRAISIAINARFSLFAIGTISGQLEFKPFPSQEGVEPKSQKIHVPNPYNRPTGSVTALDWSSDGYVLAVGWSNGWGVFSVGGRCLASSFNVEHNFDKTRFQDAFMFGVEDLVWGPGNFELLLLASKPLQIDAQIFAVPFAKSATTGQLTPDNTRYAFLQLDDRVLVYRGADQPDMSIINPESDVWQHVKIPQRYLATNWPIRYSSLSSDGRLIAVAGRRGLIHYSSTSGRWKVFADEAQDQAFSVRGGLVWFHHVLICAVEVSKTYQIRLYSRDMDLSNQNVLHRETLPSPVVILSMVDNSLLAFTLDNTLYHYLIVPTSDSIKLHLCGSISFAGIIATPSAVRMLSWMIPGAQKQLGDPADDLSVASVLMVVGGQLILLRPRKAADQEVKYDLQVFADRIEFCWIHLRGIPALENSLWAYDAQGIRVWLNALAIERPGSKDNMQNDVKESVNIPLDFYPLSVLMDKGIIIGAEHEIATRMNLPFTMFRHTTTSHLFLHHILLYHISNKQVKQAVEFATHYKQLVFFSHALEILLHTVVESDASSGHPSDRDSPNSSASNDSSLQTVIEFLDYFDASLEVVVGCARKTEMSRWRRLFDIVGNPKTLFEACIVAHKLKTAGSYLLVLHNLEQLDENSTEAVTLLKCALEASDWQLCKELLRFLHSMDETGAALRHAVTELNLASVSDVLLSNRSLTVP
ncbi:RIC1-domain-containing protein [Coprinopsis marcescibilis]|uniref:RIC1-domain-containing protein n=1 Tax=Coprinopsis marcescibilis TaxID=230819 RepID=A0A5C3LD39_COPMA|nr:RIC1-domain-containing protein [Coprinopsis marcescibilis]